MGTFSVTVEIGDPGGTRWEAVDALVGTGASYSWIPADLLERLGVEPQFAGSSSRRTSESSSVRWA